MTETAAHLVDHVIPRVPVRQWVLSFPIPLQFLLAAHPHLLSPVAACSMNQRRKLEQLYRYIARPAIANKRLKLNSTSDVVLRHKSRTRTTPPIS